MSDNQIRPEAEVRAENKRLRKEKNLHRDQEKRLRGLIWEFGLRFASGSPERKWSSAALYDEVEPVGDDFRTDAPLPESKFVPAEEEDIGRVGGAQGLRGGYPVDRAGNRLYRFAALDEEGT